MPLEATALGALLKNATQQFNDRDIEDIAGARTDYWNEIATVIINYFLANTVVNVTVATTGTAAAQTGTGVGTIS